MKMFFLEKNTYICILYYEEVLLERQGQMERGGGGYSQVLTGRFYNTAHWHIRKSSVFPLSEVWRSPKEGVIAGGPDRHEPNSFWRVGTYNK